MSLLIEKAGVQTSLQGAPYKGHRHLGMPAAGAADSLSLALANRLVGKKFDALAIEISLGATQIVAQETVSVALTGAASHFWVNGNDQPLHRSISLNAGDRLDVGSALIGCRSYLALAAELDSKSTLEGQSTYEPARLGGHHGRSLGNGDILSLTSGSNLIGVATSTPVEYQTGVTDRYLLRAIPGPEIDILTKQSRTGISGIQWTVGNRCNRMGMQLDGEILPFDSKISMNSAPVFPGTIQCPPDGKPFLLGPDAQTTGGYPRIAQIIRADRHLIGQLKPGSRIQLVFVTPARATEIYRKKIALLKPWFGNLDLW